MDANKKDGIAPFINNLEIIEIFKNEDKKEEVSVTDLLIKCYNYSKRSLRS